MKILITGGAGFLGTHLFRALESEHTVSRLDIIGGRGVRKCDVGDRAVLADEMSRASPDVVVHLAAVASVQDCESDPTRAVRSNVLGTLNVADWCSEAGARLVFTSTAAVYNTESSGPMSTHHACNPSTLYGLTKWFGEEEIRRRSSDAVILRLFNVYGEGCARSYVIPDLIRRARVATSVLEVLGTGAESRDFVYIEDVLQAFRFAIETHHRGIFNVGSGKCTSVKELATQILEIMRLELPVRFLGKRDWDFSSNWADVADSNVLPGWTPRFDLSSGLRRTIRFETEMGGNGPVPTLPGHR